MSQYNVKAYEIAGHKFNFPKTAEVVGEWEEKQVNVPVTVAKKASVEVIAPEINVEPEEEP